MADKNWIVIAGTIINTTAGDGGLEFFGPYDEVEAEIVRLHYANQGDRGDGLCVAVELIGAKLPERLRYRQGKPERA